jgi:fibronectin-binding autotransporter adhesin
MQPSTSSVTDSRERVRSGGSSLPASSAVSTFSLRAALRRLAALGLVVTSVLALTVSPTLRAQTTVYWDTNNNSNDTSTTGSGTWVNTGGSNLWTRTANGNSGITTWTSAQNGTNTIVNFSAGTGGTGTQTVTLGGNITNVGGMVFAEGTTTISGAFTLNLSQNATFDATASGTSTINSSIAGAFNLTKTGANILLLGGANTYTGNTTISVGTLQVGSTTALGNSTTGNVSVSSGAVLDLAGFSLAGSKALSLTGTGLSSNGALISSTGNATYAGAVTLGNAAVSIGGAGNTNLTGIVSSAGTATTLTKVGTGTLTLSGANTYSGNTTVSAGTLQLNNTAALGNTATGNGTIVNSGATLDLNGITLAGAEQLTLTGTGVGGNGALINNTGTGATFSGTIALGNATDSIGGTGDIILTGIISGTGTITNLTKVGTGTLTLSGTNTYNGNTTVSAGTLKLNNTAALGNTAAGNGTTVSSGAVLDLNGITLAGAELLSLTGTGISSNGALINSSGSAATFSGNITLGNVTNSIGGTGNITLSGAISAAGTATALTKVGANTLTLSGTNSYTGVTTVSSGTLRLGSTTALGATTAGNGTTVTSGAVLDLNGITLSGAEALTLSGTGLTSTGALVNNSTAATYSGNITLGAVAPSIGGTGNITLSGKIIDGSTTSLTKVGANTLFLTNANTYSGGTTIGNGTVEARSNGALGTGNITVSSGAQLNLNGANLVLGNTTVPANATYTLTVAGNGTSGTGVLVNTYTTAGGTKVQVDGNIALSGNATFNSGTTSGNILQLGIAGSYTNSPSPGAVTEYSTINLGSNTLTFNGSAGTTHQIEGRIIGTGGVVINTAGVVNYYNPQNTYTGNTTIIAGTLLIDTASNPFAPNDPNYTKFYGVSGALIIGDDNSANGNATVTLGNGTSTGTVNEAIKHDSAVTIYSDGTLNLMNNPQTIGKLTMTGGTINAGNSNLFLDQANTSVSINPTATSGASVINGTLSLTYHLLSPSESGIRQNRTFDVGYNANNVATGDLLINALVTQGSLTKTGNGTLTLATSNNDYDGTTTVNQGILNVRVGTNGSDKSSLGLSGGGAGQDTFVTGNATTGGTLQMQGGISITKEGLTLSGNGFNGTQGALENLSGNNTWGASTIVGNAVVNTGIITLDGNARIGSTAGTLTIPTTISSANNGALTISGAGNTTISGDINTGNSSATLTKIDSGTLTLSGNSFYAGNTNVQAGVVVVASNNALGSTAAGTIVTSGAELRLTNNITVPAESLLINGSGVGGTSGALRNYSGNNTYGGTVTIGTAGSTIYSDANTMTLSGGIATGGNAFIVGGAGNTTTSGTVTGSGSVTKNGSGTATFSNLAAVGNVTVNAGTLTFSGSSGMTASGNVTVNAGTLNFTGGNATVGQVHLLGNASSTINVGAGTKLTTEEFDSSSLSTLNIASGGTVVATYDSGNTTFSGQITGTGTFKATGTAQVTFDQTINNSGLTVYIGGTSVGTNASPLTFSITNNAHLTFGDLYITGDTILDFGNSSASFLTSTNLYIAAGVKVTVTNWASMVDAWYVTTSFRQTDSNGTPVALDVYGTQPQNQITFTGFSNQNTAWITQATYPSFREHEIRPVPEPSTYGALFVSGCLGLFGLRRYLRQRAVAKAK